MSVESGRGRAHRGRDDGPAPSARTEAVAALTRLLAPAVAEAGFDLEEVDVRPAGRRRLVKIVVDADGGVSLDDVALLSQTASGLLDGSDVMGAGPYVLEVTSPGVDRPLTEPRHWRRAAGRLVVAPLAEGGQIEGRVVSADDEAVVIDVAAPAKGPKGGKGGKAPKGAPRKTTRRRFALGELGRGRVQVEFRRDGDPGEPAGEAESRSPAEPD
ncbi:ribosome maturation factor RimP [Actinomadura sp. 21ATH]|uniref:ribosome maturation factor RimP n=1 Tax=Actinomadura sp. 21ATH TaxID=1735444 RepID=UPI0035BEC9AE